MRTVTIEQVTLGEGLPKIIVPLVGKTQTELFKEAEFIATVDCDIIEWRLDFFENILDFTAATELSKKLKTMLNKPLLVTFRTQQEGGELPLSEDKYFELYQQFLTKGTFELLDVELFMPTDGVKKLLSAAHKQGKKVIMSNHDFTQTPPKSEIIARLRKMQELGADICKIAVMPQTAADVLTLLEATQEMQDEYAKCPLITMSMGSLGGVSRVSGGVFGSCATFGSAVQASAPGQIPAADLRKVLQILQPNDNG